MAGRALVRYAKGQGREEVEYDCIWTESPVRSFQCTRGPELVADSVHRRRPILSFPCV